VDLFRELTDIIDGKSVFPRIEDLGQKREERSR
jgi:hypothetical protein